MRPDRRGSGWASGELRAWCQDGRGAMIAWWRDLKDEWRRLRRSLHLALGGKIMPDPKPIKRRAF